MRGLEKLWALVLKRTEGFDNYLAKILSHQDDLTKIWNHPSFGEELHSFWKESTAFENLESLLKELDHMSQVVKNAKRKRRDVDEPDAKDILERLPRFCIPSSLPHQTTGAVISSPNFEGDIHHPFVGSSNRGRVSDFGNRVLLPQNAPQLLDLYFSHTHCWLPILERSKILKSYYYACKTGGRQDDSNPDMATLWAIFALTQQQTKHLEPQTPAMGVGFTKEMYQHARCRIPTEEGPISISHVQALLLLTLVQIGLGDWQAAWLLVGQAVRLSISLGLQESQMRQRGKHTFHGCFIIDTVISAKLDRPSHLRRQHVTAIGYIEEDGIEEWDPWTNSITKASGPNMAESHVPAFTISCFNRLVEVYCLLNDILNDDRSSHDRDALHQRHSELLQDLSAKLSLAPVSLTETDSTATATSMPHYIYLRLACSIVKCAIVNHHRSHPVKVPETAIIDGSASADFETLHLLALQDKVIGLALLPPHLESALLISTKCALPSHIPAEGNEHSSFIRWYRAMMDHAIAASLTWPVYSNTLQDLAQHLGPTTINDTQPFNVAPPTYVPQMGATLTDLSQSDLWPYESGSISVMPTQSTTNCEVQTFQGGRDTNIDGAGAISAIDDGINLNLGGAMEMPASTFDTMTPSLLGDDIDAIFHDLAHLDTTD